MPRKTWECVNCRTGFAGRVRPALCGRCGLADSYGETLPERPTLTRAVDVLESDVKRVRTGDVEVDELLEGGFAEGSHALVYGAPGSGKTRLALRWLSYSRNTLWVSWEMPELLVVRTARSCGGTLRHIVIAENAHPSDIESLAEEAGADALGFDSISELDEETGIELVSVVKDWTHDSHRVALIICHLTKSGDYLGPAGLAHALDYRIQVHPRPDGAARVEVQKSRYSATGFAECSLIST